MAEIPGIHSASVDRTWDAIDRLADQAAALSKEDLPESEFYAQLLRRAVSALAAVAAAVWKWESGQPRLAYQIDAGGAKLAEQLQHPGHLEQLESVRRADQPRLLLPRSGGSAGSQAANPLEWLVLLCPVRVEQEAVGVVEVLQRPTTDPEIQEACLNLLAALCEAASDFHRNAELRLLRAERAFWRRSEAFVRRIHGGGLRQTALEIANEGRHLIDCDRVGVALRRGRRCAVLATSGVERVQRRSAAVRLLERLSAMVLATGEPLWYDGNPEDVAPEVERVLQPYVDESHVRLLALVPLVGRAPATAPEVGPDTLETIGVLIVEQFDARYDEPLRGRVATVASHSSVAMANALRARGVLGRSLDWFWQAGTLAKLAAGVLAVGAVAAALVLVPADFDIASRGELLPQRRQDVFAPVRGEVQRLAVEHNAAVTKGQPLLEMSSAELELEHERLLGERRTTQQKLLAAQSERVRKSQLDVAGGGRASSWSAIEKELQKQLEGIDAQLEVLGAQREKLRVRSPMDGRVATWDVRQLLESRPVEPGQVLLTVADVRGPWELDLKIPDHHISHVLKACQRWNDGPPVRFILKTNPDVTYEGRIERICARTTTDEDGASYVKAVVAIDRNVVAPLRYGTAVAAKVHCGRRCIGYVWLHDLIDAVKTWVLF